MARKKKKDPKGTLKEKKAGKKAARVLKKDIKTGKKESKVERVMHEWKEGDLHSGSKKGPKVRNQKQAVAIALSEARRMSKKKKRK